LVSTQQIANAIQGFGEEYRAMVFCRYNKSLSLSDSVASNAPTFHDVSDFFGEEAVKFWLRFHIAETFAFLGIYDTASKFQVQHTADLILSHPVYGQLTLSEFLSFLQKFKMGHYGKIYQSARPNPQEFLMCLEPFWRELSAERIRQEEQQRADELSRILKDPNNMTREEYNEIKTIERMYEMQINR
jgi:hypothetical protein